MSPSHDEIARLRSVSRALLRDAFFLDAVEKLAWRILDTENTLTDGERSEYVAALVQKMRTELAQHSVDENPALTGPEVAEITDAAMIAAWDFAKTQPVATNLH